MDRFDKATRSRVMSRSKARGTKATEGRFRSLLVRSGVRGWTLGHDSGLIGRPDVIFVRKRVAIFVDGCFWHGCRRCRSIPATNYAFWTAKIQRNRLRDRKVRRILQADRWIVLRIWEHDIRNDGPGVLRKVIDACSRSSFPT
jgi:DNA mismatch endonuclease (patch repair protein)